MPILDPSAPRLRRRAVALVALAALPAPLIALGAAAPAAAQRRIVGGTSASTGDHPWMVALSSRAQFGSSRSGQFCGGALVTPTKVVTAAHCFYDETTGRPVQRPGLRAIVGRDDLRGSAGREVAVSGVWIEPNYSFAANSRDVAVVTLAEPQEDRQVLEMVGAGESRPYAVGTPATVFGWGDTRGNGSYSNTLRQVTVPVLSDAACGRAYPGGPDSAYDATSMVCAGEDRGGKDACQGDSGGPLLVGGRLAGLVSWGAGCAQAGRPGVYTRISAVAESVQNVL
ncbi:S1 family peptidase [Kitasatospora sp. NPDC004615]|uniref:S1 family peptidase n=1 Tax=Kitasatospora sp. NPDC004615 TaxID=3364017 RepID=UPI0036C0F95C